MCVPHVWSLALQREEQIKSGNPQVPVMQAEDDKFVCCCGRLFERGGKDQTGAAGEKRV